MALYVDVSEQNRCEAKTEAFERHRNALRNECNMHDSVTLRLLFYFHIKFDSGFPQHMIFYNITQT